MTRALVVLGGLAGALGVVASALATHGDGAANLARAANFLLFHASALLALAALVHGEVLPRRGVLAGAALLVLGLALFSGDLALRSLAGRSLFPMAAPSGGTLLIAGWLVIGMCGFFAVRR